MSDPQNSRVWLVTGAGSGLGRQLAEALVDRGERIVATARELEAAEDLEARNPKRALAAQLDVRDADQASRVVKRATEAFGRIDVLVNNAGFGVFGALEEVPDEELRREFDTNVFGAINAIRAVLPVMRAQRSGHVVQVSSLEGVAPALAGEGPYAATKFAMEGVCETLAKEVAHLGIGVTIVEPGPIRTDFAQRAVAAEPSDPDYGDSVGRALEWFADLDGKQPNDPARVAAAIIEAIDAPDPPLRLPLGAEAIEAIREKLETQGADLETWEPLGRSTSIAA